MIFGSSQADVKFPGKKGLSVNLLRLRWDQCQAWTMLWRGLSGNNEDRCPLLFIDHLVFIVFCSLTGGSLLCWCEPLLHCREQQVFSCVISENKGICGVFGTVPHSLQKPCFLLVIWPVMSRLFYTSMDMALPCLLFDVMESLFTKSTYASHFMLQIPIQVLESIPQGPAFQAMVRQPLLPGGCLILLGWPPPNLVSMASWSQWYTRG